MPHDLMSHFAMLARYNSIANARIYELCAQLSDEEFRKARTGSFGSIFALLNHVLLGDTIWMGRLTATGYAVTPPLNTVLHHELQALSTARRLKDDEIEAYMATLSESTLSRDLTYVSAAGIQFTDPVPFILAHMFNHQTHHRGQLHVMLADAGLKAPSLDLHRVLRPAV